MTFNSGYALAIAPGSYKNAPRLDVPITIKDVREVADVLGDEKYCGYPKDRIVVLKGAEATRQKILDALDDLAELGEGDTLLLFYSGHGECGEDRSYYLTAHDTEFNDSDEVIGSGISEKELLEKINAIAAKRVFLIFNACYSGAISPDSLGSPETLGTSGQNIPDDLGKALLATGEGRVIITACREDQKSSFFKHQPLTIFAESLVEGLRGKGVVAREGYISIFDLYEYVFKKTKAEVEKQFGDYGRVQEPEITIHKGIGAMAVALYHGIPPEGQLGSEDMPESLKGFPREIEPAESQRLLEKILSGEIKLARDTADTVGGDKIGGDKISITAPNSQGVQGKVGGKVTQIFNKLG